MSSTDVPQVSATLACNLSAIPPTDRLRYSELRSRLAVVITSCKEIDTGYVLHFGADRISTEEVSEWIHLERLCCPWLLLELESTSLGALEVRMTALPQGKQVLRTELADFLEPISMNEV